MAECEVKFVRDTDQNVVAESVTFNGRTVLGEVVEYVPWTSRPDRLWIRVKEFYESELHGLCMVGPRFNARKAHVMDFTGKAVIPVTFARKVV